VTVSSAWKLNRSSGDLVRFGQLLVVAVGFASFLVAALHCRFVHAHTGDGLVGCLGRIFALVAALVTAASIGLHRSGLNFTEDLSYLITGIDRMVSGDVIGDPIALRTYDELGLLTKRFAVLREHFLEALARERAARRALEEADSYKSEFLTAVSHELRTPLNAILGFADILLDEIDGELTEAQREDVQLIRSAGAHLMDLFNDVLDLAAAASGRLRLERKRFAIGPLLKKLVAEAEGLTVGRDVTLSAEVPDELPEVYADPRRVRQIVLNLVENAMKFTEKGSVRVTVDATGARVRIRVVDTGVGIPPESLGTIFEEFEQTAAEGRRGRGAGLGLAICRRLTELQGGTIRVESVVGRGSVFTVVLPVRKRPW
jgi:signal transduction histidine kinase